MKTANQDYRTKLAEDRLQNMTETQRERLRLFIEEIMLRKQLKQMVNGGQQKQNV